MTTPAPPAPLRLFTFAAGASGAWRIRRQDCLTGEPLPQAAALDVIGHADTAPRALPAETRWSVRAITSNERYVEPQERTALVSRQHGLGRASMCAAFIPLRKKATWWALTQGERRQIFEAQSAHIGIGMRYLPAVARRLHHCRDLSPFEPFDFVTWFEFAAADEPAFDALLQALRATPEWDYVDREIDIRLEKPGA